MKTLSTAVRVILIVFIPIAYSEGGIPLVLVNIILGGLCIYLGVKKQ